MKKLFILLFAMLSLWAISSERFNKLLVKESVINVGIFPANEARTGVFTIQNDTENTVKLGRLRSGCPCTSSNLSHNELSPDAASQLSITLNANSQKGEFTQTFYLETDVPGQKYLRLQLVGTAKPIITITPSENYYAGAFAPNETRELLFTLIPQQEDVTLETASTDFTADKIKLTKDKKNWLLRLSVTAPEKGGDFSISCQLKVLNPVNWPNYPITIRGTVLSATLP